MTLTSQIKIIVMLLISRLSMDQFKKKIDHIDGISVGNKNVLSSDLKNVDQGYNL